MDARQGMGEFIHYATFTTPKLMYTAWLVVGDNWTDVLVVKQSLS